MICVLGLALVAYFIHNKGNHAADMPRKESGQPATTSKEPKARISNTAAKPVVRVTPEQLYDKAVTRVRRDMKNRKDKLDGDYAELFSRLGLSEKELDVLRDLIVELEFAGHNAWLDPKYPPSSNPDYREVEKVAEGYKQNINTDIKNLFGEDKYKVISHYMETLDGRRTCNAITVRFAYEAEPLSTGARESLVDILHETNQAYLASGLPLIDRIAADTFMRDKTLERAQSVLTPSQLKSIENYYNEQINVLTERKKAGMFTW